MGKMPSAILLFIILLIMELGICCIARNSTFGCVEGEMKALLRFKASLKDPYNRLSSWNWKNKECCAWQGVKCNEITGHVIKLDLRNKKFDYWNGVSGSMLRGKTVDTSLMELKYLWYLDLSGNDFKGSKIPEFLGSMKELQYLNFSSANFSGVVPHHLGYLSSLRKLDLNCYQGSLIVDDLMWATNLSSLAYLDMSYVNLSSTKDIVKVFQMLPSLVVLRLSYSKLDNTHLPHACINSTLLTNVQYLDLSQNSLEGEFPCFLPNMTSLRFLDLSYNMFNFSLIHLLQLKNLVNLNLFDNNFYGDISRLFKNLSGCWSHNLEYLIFGYNNFYGHLPTSLGKLSALRELSLYENQLSGEIPISLGQLSNLESLDISYNSFKGTLSEAHFANLSKLEYLRADSTMLKFRVGYDWVPPFQLNYLMMESSKIGGQFPLWLQTQKALTYLDLSNCSITGTLPEWLHSMNLTNLDLSDNCITGPIPELPSSIIALDLSDNMITRLPSNIGHTILLLQSLELAHNSINGSIPDSLCELKALETLDLFMNHLSGNLPDCWYNLQNLKFVSLSSNELSGVIPSSIGGAYSLEWLQLTDNNLVGQLPSTLKNCSRLEALDVRGNNLSGKLPEWIGKCLLDLKVLILRDNKFYGMIPSVFCQLSQLRVMDLANNKLTGNIPHCFGNFSSMISGSEFEHIWNTLESFSQVMKGMELDYTTNYVVNLDLSSNHLAGEIPTEMTTLSGLIGLNLSHNRLGGEIPARIGDLKSLESLDLSNNNLFGKIPDTLSNLSFLSDLNLSNNNLAGQIPTGPQLQALDDPSIYDGNPQLCGTPLLKKCRNDKAPKASNVENHEPEDGDRADKICFYAFIIAGFATGFWGYIGILVIKTKWRQAYFKFIEEAMSKMMGY